MYAEIADIGYEIENYNEIRTFADLLQKINPDKSIKLSDKNISSYEIKNSTNNNSIGIDIENVSNFKTVTDYREDYFYKQNFSEQEISHCLLQTNTLQSFAGKFAAKEAIVKADNSLINHPFNKIEVFTDKNGKPFFQNLFISISHTENLAIAVAMQIKEPENINSQKVMFVENKKLLNKYLSISAIIISIIAITTSILQILLKD